MEHKADLINCWARADTLAFSLFIPIIHSIKRNEPLNYVDLDTACSLATLAIDLKELMHPKKVDYDA